MESTGKQTLTILQTCHKDKRKAMARLHYVTQYRYTVYTQVFVLTYVQYIYIDIYIHVLSCVQYMSRHNQINPKGAGDLCWRPHIPEARL